MNLERPKDRTPRKPVESMGNILTQSQIRFYRENGYCVVEGIFDSGVLDKARGIADDLLSSPDLSGIAEAEAEDGTKARRIWAPTARDRVFSELAEDSRLLDAISQLIGEDIVLQCSKLNVKPPQVGSVVDWHQDFAYHPHSNTDLVAALIYLDDATRKNTCLHVAAGSHRNGLLSHEHDGCFGGRISSLENVGVDESTVVDCEGRAGTVVFLHPLVVHSSEKNLSDLYRRVFIPAYRAADALPLYYGPHAAHNEPPAKLLGGKPSKTARSKGGGWRLPIAEAEFNSLYEIQEGCVTSHENVTLAW
ncbi:phytanoyl-CoA dioxygenase family protein [Streptomyces inhibens]|uniref:phytanoyl-CoA dioxygenase family protein n=1 Tax=Streptomyces inhibens TaxID=2293571 RepID=UPI00379A5F3B